MRDFAIVADYRTRMHVHQSKSRSTGTSQTAEVWNMGNQDKVFSNIISRIREVYVVDESDDSSLRRHDRIRRMSDSPRGHRRHNVSHDSQRQREYVSDSYPQVSLQRYKNHE